MSLEQELPGGLIPAIADETVIKWGLGLGVGDTLHYTNSNGGTMDLLLIGGLAPSVFQGNVIISNESFLEQFPESSGTHVFLVDGALADTATIRSELGTGHAGPGMGNGADSRPTGRIQFCHQYLSIHFPCPGSTGIAGGDIWTGGGAFPKHPGTKTGDCPAKSSWLSGRQIRKLVVREYMILLLAGIGTGFVAAILATLPSILNPNTGTSFSSILLWLLILVVNGWIWIQLVARSALKDESHLFCSPE